MIMHTSTDKPSHSVYVSRFSEVDLERERMKPENELIHRFRPARQGPGEPGGTRAMGVCEPGQGGNAAAINNTFMCAGEPPRLTRPPA